MKKTFVVFALLVCVCAVGFAQDSDRVFEKTTTTPAQQTQRAPGSLTTLFAWNNGYAGNTFDFTPSMDIYCTALDVNWISAGESIDVDAYYCVGSCVGFENDPSHWTLLGSNSNVAAGPDLPTAIDLSGNGVQFLGGNVYGMYVDVSNYPSLIGFLGYTNGLYSYSNSDLSIDTNTGQVSPAFGGSFYPRAWNGTFHYDTSGVAYPILDIQCNGQNANVEIWEGDNATLTLDLQARDFAGFPVDLWVAIVSPAGNWFTFQWGNWYPGLGHAAWSSGLIDWSGTVLDMALPLGQYTAYFALDVYQNGLLDVPLFDMDEVDFEVVVPPTEYKWDSGTTDNLLCWTSGGDMVGMHCFDTIPGGENLTNVGTIFGSVLYANYAPGNGTPTEFYVWEATSFGDPTNATLLAQGTGVVGNVDTDVHYWDACPCTITTPNFYVAYNLHHAAYEYCLAIDGSVTYVPGAAFYTGTNTLNAFDPVNLYANQYPPAESPYGFWTARAEY